MRHDLRSEACSHQQWPTSDLALRADIASPTGRSDLRPLADIPFLA